MAKNTGELTLIENLTPTDQMLIFDGEHTRRAPSTALTGVLNAGNLKMPDSDETIAEHYRQFCNRNLLINSIFTNENAVVNQRSQDVYTDTGYSIDMWYKDPHLKVELMDSFLRITKHEAVANPAFRQKLENNDIIGKTVTFSVLYRTSSTGIRSITSAGYQYLPASDDWNLFSYTHVMKTGDFGSWTDSIFGGLQFTSGINAGNYIDIKAAKLEPGPNQTLAHKEGSEWVLNEIPDYATELAKCQRYQVLGNLYGMKLWTYNKPGSVGVFFPLPVTMRNINPEIVGKVEYSKNGSATVYTVDNIRDTVFKLNGIYLYVQSSTIDFSDVSVFFIKNGGFDANL